MKNKMVKSIGVELWRRQGYLQGNDAEFTRVTLIGKNENNFSVIFPNKETNLKWTPLHGSDGIARVVCEAPETGVEYISAYFAGKIKTTQHYRLKKELVKGLNQEGVFLTPLASLATETRPTHMWNTLFNPDSAWRAEPELIAKAVRIIVEQFSICDELCSRRLVYDAKSKKVHVEYLHNHPQNYNDPEKYERSPDWRLEPLTA